MHSIFQWNEQKEIQILCALLRATLLEKKMGLLQSHAHSLIRSYTNVKETEFIYNKQEN